MSIAIALVLLAAAYCAIVFSVQRSVLFPAPRLSPPSLNGDGEEAIRLEQPAGTMTALFLQPTTAVAGPAPLIIFTHGNAELAEMWIDEFATPRAWGWAVLLVEYPGYGNQPGRPSEQSIDGVVTAAYDWAKRDPRIDVSRIVAYGRSVGGGPAARLAATRPLAALILESSFTSVAPLAARFLVPPFLLRDRFDNLAALRHYHDPLLVLHGERDEIIPMSHGRALAAAVPGARFVEMRCGHNDCPRPWASVKTFFEEHGLMTPAPPRLARKSPSSLP